MELNNKMNILRRIIDRLIGCNKRAIDSSYKPVKDNQRSNNHIIREDILSLILIRDKISIR